MPDTRNVHSPYPRGQGLTSVPVLFSLPNVQPVIAAASMTAASEPTGEIAAVASPSIAVPSSNPAPASPAGARSPSIAPAVATQPSSEIGNAAAGNADPGRGRLFSSHLMSQLTNVTIGVLLIAVCALAIRNFQGPPSASQEITHTEPEPTTVPNIEMPSGIQVRTASLPSAPQANPGFAASATSTSSMPAVSLPAVSMPTASMPSGSLAVESTASNDPFPSETPAASTPAIPLLLPKAPPQASASTESHSKDSEPRSLGNGPYGTSSAATLPASNSPILVPANLASTSTSLPSVAPATPRAVTPTVPAAIDTDTPTLNTRDIILMRSGQRRAQPIASPDPSLPKMESVPKIESLSRPADSRGAATVMSGQTYPPVAPQFEPISMNPGALGSGSSAPLAAPQDSPSTARNRYQPIGNPVTQPSPRITQPTSSPAAPAPSRPYAPLSPTLQNPNGNSNLDSDSTPNNLP